MGTVAQLTAQPVPFTYKDVEYKLNPWTFEIQGLFERYLEKHIIDSFMRTSHILLAEYIDKTLAAIYRDIGAGVYTFGTETIGKALQAPPHMKYMFWLCLKKNHKEVTLELVYEMAKDSAVWERMVEAMTEANADPNAKAKVTSEMEENQEKTPPTVAA